MNSKLCYMSNKKKNTHTQQVNTYKTEYKFKMLELESFWDFLAKASYFIDEETGQGYPVSFIVAN